MTSDERPPRPQGQDLAELFKEHGEGLAGAVRGILGPRADCQEVLQEAFTRALQALRRDFVPDSGVAWIFVITMNLAKDLRRRRKRRGGTKSLEDANPMELQSREPAPQARLERAEALAAARMAICDLKHNEKEVFLLRSSAGLSFEEAARALGIPVGTAKTRMRAALARLRRNLRDIAPGTFRSQSPKTSEGRQAL
jgi:RNA polymerase sigma-70 factor (ECF subfamily)